MVQPSPEVHHNHAHTHKKKERSLLIVDKIISAVKTVVRIPENPLN